MLPKKLGRLATIFFIKPARLHWSNFASSGTELRLSAGLLYHLNLRSLISNRTESFTTRMSDLSLDVALGTEGVVVALKLADGPHRIWAGNVVHRVSAAATEWTDAAISGHRPKNLRRVFVERSSTTECYCQTPAPPIWK
jgi:hypothetical protein